jgi:hypothetical protein
MGQRTGPEGKPSSLAGKFPALFRLKWDVLALMDWLGVRNVASYMRHFDAHPLDALHLLLGRLSRQDG